jgi:hypothetical protein
MTSHWIRRGAAALAAARAGLGVAALVSPALIARPWVGGEVGPAGEARGPAARVLGRALGARDLALGLGALAALQGGAPGGTRTAPGAGAAPGAGVWIGAGALSDSLDVLATATAWDELPAAGRWLVVMSAGGAAVSGAVAAWLLITGEATGGS